MNRLMALVVVLGLTVGATGCATGVEDPQPPEPSPTKSNPAPVTPFAADDIDTSVPDPNQIGTGLEAPKPDLEQIQPPIPTNGDPIDPMRETKSWLDEKIQAPIPVGG